jgi:uncharacterized coiled-coil DUF342 family protein
VAIFIIGRKRMKIKKGFPSASLTTAPQISRELIEAERKIKEAQAEINKLKNKERLKEVERKFEEDKKLLERLRRGETDFKCA